MWKRVSDLLGMIKFSHTLFALPFAILGALLAASGPSGVRGGVREWVGILLCMATARSAAMAFNRLVDREFDAANPRTAGRHLPAGTLSVRSVAIFTVVNCVLFVGATSLFLPNRLPLILSIPVLLWLLGYSYAKRFTSLPHLWLGAALMLAPMSAWIALRGDFGWPPLWLGLAVLFWVTGFDVIYACQDEAHDRSVGLRSLPARLGARRALRVAAMLHAATVVCLVALWRVYPMGSIFLGAVALVALLLAYEHAIVRPDDLSRVNQAFFQVNIAISIGLMIAGGLDLWAAAR
ncbi:MAG: UbiA-like polyprenyltransferase [Isosphaeraceae bacterium]|nr:UbiA-like polyprenyltransferase [Isosphaeraceae bacterium]